MEYLLKANAVIILFYLCYKLFLQRETYFQSNRWFLLVGLFTAIALPLVVIPIYIEYTPMPIAFYETTEIATQQVTEQTQSINYWTLLPYLYGIGLLFFFIRLIAQFGSLITLFKRNQKTKKEQFYFIETKDDIPPFSFFNRIVFNPKQYTSTELNHIITHEKIHAKQLHSLDVIIIQVATILFWFNPFIWWYKKELQQNLEFIADQKTQQQIECAKSYQTVLLKASLSQNQLALPNNFYQSLIKKRIIMLQKSKSKTSSYLKLAIVLPFLALFLMSFNVEEIYVAKAEIAETKITDTFTITATSTDQEIEAIKNRLEAQTDGLKIRFSDVKRNSKDEIIKLSIETKTKEKSTFTKNMTFKSETEKPIENLLLKIENGDLTLVGKNMIMTFTKKGAVAKLIITDEETVLSEEIDFQSNETTSKEYLTTKNQNTNYEKDSLKINFKSKNTFILSNKLNDSLEIMTLNNNGNLIKNSKVLSSSDNLSTFLNKKDNKTFTMAVTQTSKDGKMIDENVKFISNNKLNDTIFFSKNTLKYTDSIRPKKVMIQYPNGDTNASQTIGIQNFFIRNDSVVVFIDGNKANRLQMSQLDPNDIKSMNVLKGNSATQIYGNVGENRVVQITTKTESPWKVRYDLNNKNQAINYDNHLYLLDGKEISKPKLEKLYANKTISILTVLDKKEGKEKYGEKGKNGVVELINNGNQKNANTFIIKDSTKTDGPWRVSHSEISSIVYIDDEDATKNGSIIYVSKKTSDISLKEHKKFMKDFKIDVKINKLKRNIKGEITKIKISLKDNKGQKSSATYQSEDGIPKIQYGSKNGKLYISSDN